MHTAAVRITYQGNLAQLSSMTPVSSPTSPFPATPYSLQSSVYAQSFALVLFALAGADAIYTETTDTSLNAAVGAIQAALSGWVAEHVSSKPKHSGGNLQTFPPSNPWSAC